MQSPWITQSCLIFPNYYTTIGSKYGVHYCEEIMQSQKLSISLSKQQCEFIEHYLVDHKIKNRSEVIKEALYLLQQRELETCYREANQDIDHDFENTNLDGIENNEAW